MQSFTLRTLDQIKGVSGLIKQHTMKAYGVVESELNAFLTLALNAGKQSASYLGQSPLYYLDRMLGGSRSWPGLCG